MSEQLPTNAEQHESGMYYNQMKDRQHLYALTREDLATVENELIKLQRNSKLSIGARKAIVSAAASMITLLDIVQMLGVGEGLSERGVGENGCLSSLIPINKNYIFENGTPFEKFPKNSENVSKKLIDMLQFLASVTLTEEEWLDSYDLYVKHRASPKKKECGQQQNGS